MNDLPGLIFVYAFIGALAGVFSAALVDDVPLYIPARVCACRVFLHRPALAGSPARGRYLAFLPRCASCRAGLRGAVAALETGRAFA